LKPCFQPLVASFDSADDSTVEELVVVGYDRIDNAPVNAEYFSRYSPNRSFKLGNEVEKNITSLDSECCGSDFTRSVFDVAIGDFDRNFDSSLERGQGNNSGIQERGESVVIQSNRRMLLLNGKSLQLLTLEYVARLVTGSTNITAVEFGMLSPNLLVSSVVDFGLVESLTLETSLESDVAGCVVEPYCFGDSFVKGEFKVDCSLHSEYPLGFAI
jgi:hypothetical protein